MEKWTQLRDSLAAAERTRSDLRIALREAEEAIEHIKREETRAYLAIPEGERPLGFATMPPDTLERVFNLACADVVARSSINAVCKHWNRVMKKRVRRFVLNDNNFSKMLSGRTLLVVEKQSQGYTINAYDLTDEIRLIASDIAKQSRITCPALEFTEERVIRHSRRSAKGFTANKVHLVSEDTVMLMSSHYGRGGIQWRSLSGTHASITLTKLRIDALYGSTIHRFEQFESCALGVASMHISDNEFLIVDARDGKGGRITVLRDGILSMVHASKTLFLMRKYVSSDKAWHIYSIDGNPITTVESPPHHFMFDLPDGSLTFMVSDYTRSKFVRVSPLGEIHTYAISTMYIDIPTRGIAASPNRHYFACVQPDYGLRSIAHINHMCTHDCPRWCDGMDDNAPRTICVYRTADVQLVATFDTFEFPKTCDLSVDNQGRVFALYEDTNTGNAFNVYAFPRVR